MEANLECPVCLNLFSSIFKPKSLPCGHSFCSNCVDSMLEKPNRLCPLCNSPIQASSIPINYSLLERVIYYEILCTVHPNEMATHFSLDTVTAYCLECAKNSSGLNLIEANYVELGNLLLRKGFEIEFSLGPKLTQEIKEKLRKLTGCKNMDRIQILREVLKKTQQPECETHNCPGSLIDLSTGKVLCSQCKHIANELLMSDPEIEKKLGSRIIEVAARTDSVKFSYQEKENLKNLQTLNLIEKLSLFQLMMKKCSTKQKQVIPAICNNCNQEYSFPNNLPVKLPCIGGHYICEICAKLIKNCPIDFSVLDPSQFIKLEPELPTCHVCSQPFDSNLLPELQPCGIVRCAHCQMNPCQFCSYSHNSINKQICRYFIQLEEYLSVKCINDGKPAWIFSKSELKAFCSVCGKNKPGEYLNNFDLSKYLISECQSKASQLGSRLTPVLINSLQALPISSNSVKLQLLKTLCNISAPVSAVVGKINSGLQIPSLTIQGHYMQRFNSILPNPLQAHNKNVRPWYIKRNENQVEVFAFAVSKKIKIIGVSLTCPVDDKPGLVEFVDLYEGEIAICRLLTNRNVRGCVEDILFDSQVLVRENARYQLVYKYNVELVYKGNPLDRTDCVGTDGTCFDVIEGYLKGLVVNGQSHISGPLVRIVYN